MRIEINEAEQILKSGGIVAIPTETVYGLAASLSHPEAIRKLFQIKGRPSRNPLIIHVSELSQIIDFKPQIDESFFLLAKEYWPGPLTLVLTVDIHDIPNEVRAGLPTAAFRVPSHHLALEILRGVGPLVMPSANLSGRPSATQWQHVEVDFGTEFPVVDGGECQKGMESTVMIFEKGKWGIIRQGVLSPEVFQTILGYIPEIILAKGETPICPGQMFRHYAPKTKLKLVEKVPDEWKGVILGFSDRKYPDNTQLIKLGDLKCPESIAARLYHLLRQLDEDNISEAYVDISFPKVGILGAVHERLSKASEEN